MLLDVKIVADERIDQRGEDEERDGLYVAAPAAGNIVADGLPRLEHELFGRIESPFFEVQQVLDLVRDIMRVDALGFGFLSALSAVLGVELVAAVLTGCHKRGGRFGTLLEPFFRWT